MLNLSFRRLRARFTLLAVVALSALLLRSVAFAQTSVSNGSISGTVTDTTGAVVPNAKVTITGLCQKRPSSDVAKEAGVSTMTVSRVLNGRGRLAGEARLGGSRLGNGATTPTSFVRKIWRSIDQSRNVRLREDLA